MVFFQVHKKTMDCFGCLWNKKSPVRIQERIHDKLYPAIHFMLTNRILEEYLTRTECMKVTSVNKELHSFRSELPIRRHLNITACLHKKIVLDHLEDVRSLRIRSCFILSLSSSFRDLRVLTIFWSPLSREMWGQLGSGISNCASLSKVELIGNNMKEDHLSSFFSSMPMGALFRNVSYLDVGANHMGDEGTIVLARNVWRFPSLFTFDSCSNDMGDVGMEHLARALGENCKRLHDCHFFFNNIDEKGVFHMTQHLSYLHKIYMFDNRARADCQYNMRNIYWGV